MESGKELYHLIIDYRLTKRTKSPDTTEGTNRDTLPKEILTDLYCTCIHELYGASQHCICRILEILNLKYTDQILKAATNKLPVQPYLILQGTLLNCCSPLLVIDSVKYKFNSISKAFDTMFKAYHVLDASYPKASSHIHLIIQRCIYKIKTKFDNVMPHIADILDL
ncbi:hypothetical protein ACJJTC_015111 [Scirpophaga incertulas]